MRHERGDVVALLEQQHTQARGLLESLRSKPDRELFAALVRLLAAHESAEEMVVYPAVRSSLPDGGALADTRLDEERAAKKMLADLETMGVDHDEFPDAFARFADEVLRHATNEERQVFPLLRSELSEEQRRDMAGAIEVAESTAPTHAHRHAPTSAVGNLVIGPFVSLVDRIRDAFRGRRAS